MLFNSITFAIFFAIVYCIYWSISKKRRPDFLILSSAFFYIWFSWIFFFHFLFVILLNYFFYIRIKTSQNNPKSWMILSVLFNCINLGFFKYFYFFSRVLADLTGYPFFTEIQGIVHIVLPLAISFYSFQMIAAAVDAERNPEGKTISLREYFLFVLFFPVLIAGPIMRTGDFFPNLNHLEPDRDKIYNGCYLMLGGLIKKVLIADPAAGLISPVFSNPATYDFTSLILAGIGYSIQVFCDFSGLTDMARGVGALLGFYLPENFRAPFLSLSGRELWQRWHITLSFWLRDYIYFSLGGSKVAVWRTHLNLILTMTIGGFWHGADYTFIAWGFYWGVLLAVERYLETSLGWKLTPDKNFVLKIFKVWIVFLLFSFGAILFRANNAKTMIQHVFGIFENVPNKIETELVFSSLSWLGSAGSLIDGNSFFMLNQMENLEKFFYLFLGLVFFNWVQYVPGFWKKFRKYDPWLLTLVGVISVFLLALFSEDSSAFIYYKF
ncbi:putative alginate O-acetyltransferase AlgI [Leptospira noguchii str. 1993005606]|uniref:Alginate O-acetyltransferase AlgI n=2 Tax=Leptospira noguchii TaxID=28182 RepID=A0ABN0IXG9_9LEPT|nr:MBOAT family O-acyltransferase [Leptospira noguchii]EMM99015.1 putative alginate O-acetyltransferase AlgI [Leptospira noguchii str. 2007001578]EMO90046.1 putative alginate O-acetyltransferase AlgI [Leptospira noguchii str. 2001034031]EPE85789.1 putative alginate O-acetyltransferase AlgI [Leptospira noguchii str. 1993005606]